MGIATEQVLFEGDQVTFEDVAARIKAHEILGSPVEQRKGYSQLIVGDEHPADTSAGGVAFGGDVLMNGVPVRRFFPNGKANREYTSAIVYFHGGGYVFGSPDTHARLARQLADRINLPVYLPRYRRAPEHVWPAQMQDALAVVRQLREEGVEKIALGGDSAGGHLALTTGLELAKIEQPVDALFLFSPDTDRSGKSDTRETNTPKDVMNSHEDDLRNAQISFGSEYPCDHVQCSPLLDRLTLLPPTHMEVGDVEVLLGEAQLLHDWGTDQGATISLHKEPQAFHMWQLWTPYLPEADQSIQRAVEFIRPYL